MFCEESGCLAVGLKLACPVQSGAGSAGLFFLQYFQEKKLFSILALAVDTDKAELERYDNVHSKLLLSVKEKENGDLCLRRRYLKKFKRYIYKFDHLILVIGLGGRQGIVYTISKAWKSIYTK